jgi:hypothetical protein
MSILHSSESPIKVEGTATSVFYLPPSGKPDPNAPWIPGEERPRIPQASQKGDTCWYYGGFQPLRLKIGNNHPPLESYIKAREFEKTCSALRKGLSHAGVVSYFVNGIADSNLSIERTEQNILNTLFDAKEKNQPIKEIKRLTRVYEAAVDATLVEKRFQEQTKIQDLKTFNKENNIQAHIQQDLQFLHAVGADPIVMYANFKKGLFIEEIFKMQGRHASLVYTLGFEPTLAKKCEGLDAEWEGLQPSSKQIVLDAFCREVILQRLGFHPSCWKPCHTIDQLIKALNIEGPLYVSGYFGTYCYTQRPTHKIAKWDRNIFGWEKDDRKTEEEIDTENGRSVTHAVLLIGAEKLESAPGGGIVYYADPSIGSDPKNPKKQRFFRISYQELAEHVNPVPLIPLTLQSGFELCNSGLRSNAFYCRPEEAIFPHQEEPNFEPIKVSIKTAMARQSQLGICFAPSWDVPIACSPSRSKENKWYTRIPKGVEFAFVQMNPDYTIEWEKAPKNRILSPHWPTEKTLLLNKLEF